MGRWSRRPVWITVKNDISDYKKCQILVDTNRIHQTSSPSNSFSHPSFPWIQVLRGHKLFVQKKPSFSWIKRQISLAVMMLIPVESQSWQTRMDYKFAAKVLKKRTGGLWGSLPPQESWRSQGDLHLPLLGTQVDRLQPTFNETQTRSRAIGRPKNFKNIEAMKKSRKKWRVSINALPP